MFKKAPAPTLLELFEKHAASANEAKRVYRLVEGHDLLSMSLEELLSLKGVGRKAALLIIEVVCDLKGKK